MNSGGRRVGAGRKSKFGEKTVALRIPESMLESVQNQINNVHNQNESVYNQVDSVQNQLAQIKAIVSEYESKAHPSSVRWDVAKKLIVDLKKALS